MKTISTESMIYNFIVGFSTCNQKTNDQDNEGNTKKRKRTEQFLNIFKIIVY